MNGLQETRPAEVRLDEENHRLATVSVSTLLYMMDYGLAREQDLGRHRVNLGYLAEEEHDLFEAMRLSLRLSRVEENVARTARVNERIRFELLARECGLKEPTGYSGAPVYSPFTTDANHDKSGADEDESNHNDSVEDSRRRLG